MCEFAFIVRFSTEKLRILRHLNGILYMKNDPYNAENFVEKHDNRTDVNKFSLYIFIAVYS